MDGTQTSRSLNSQIESALIGRRGDLMRLMRSLGDGNDGLRIVHLSGPSGIGKTALVDVVCSDQKFEELFDIVRIQGRGGTSTQLCAPLLDALPEIAPMLSVRSAFSTEQNVQKSQQDLATYLEERAFSRSLLIVVDDIQSLDSNSIAALHAMTKISEDANVSILIVEQTDAPTSDNLHKPLLRHLADEVVVQSIAVEALDVVEIASVIENGLSLDISGQLVEGAALQIAKHAQGNPGYALELAKASIAQSGELPTTIAAAIRIRLSAMSEAAQLAAELIALHDAPLSMETMSRIDASIRLVDVTDSLLSFGIAIENGICSEPHPLVRTGIAGSISTAARRMLHRELAGVFGEDATSADEYCWYGVHLCASGDVGAGIQQLEHAANLFCAVGRPLDAIRMHRMCSDVCESAEQRIRHTKQALQVAAEVGSTDRVVIAEELVRLGQAANDVDAMACALVMRSWITGGDDVMRDVERAAELAPETSGWSARAAAQLLHASANSLSDTLEAESRALHLASQSQDLWLETISCERLAILHAISGDAQHAMKLFERSEELARRLHMHDSAIGSIANAAEVATMELQPLHALEIVERGVAYCDSHELDAYKPLLAATASRIQLSIGNLESARALLSQFAVLPAGMLPADAALVRYAQALVSLESLDVEAAVVAVDTFVEAAKSFPGDWGDILVGFTKAMLHDVLGQWNQAMTAIEQLPEVDQMTDLALVALWCVRTSVVREDHSLSGAIEQFIRQLAVSESVPLVAAAIDEIQATLTALQENDTSQLVTMSRRWESSGRIVDALRCTVTELLVRYRIAGNPAEREELFTTMLEHHNNLRQAGLLRDADKLAMILRANGRFARASNAQSGTLLTDRDRQVVALVQRGLSNAEIAEQLSLTVSAVGVRLWKMYERTGTNSRMQLLNWISENQ